MPVTKTTAFFAFIMFLFFSGFSKVYAQRYGRVISFGDSLSDRGNYARYYEKNQGKKLPHDNKYTSCLEGRASNGLLWCEQLFNPQQRNDNFAFLSARTGRQFNKIDPMIMADIPSLDFQIDMALYGSHEEIWPKIEDFENKMVAAFLDRMNRGVPINHATFAQDFLAEQFENLKVGKVARKFEKNELVSIWIGMNDLRSLRNLPNPELYIDDCVNNAARNIHHGINRLIAAGAQNFVVLSLPTIFQTAPADKPKKRESELKGAKLFNLRLWQELQLLAKEHPNINIIPIDVAALGEIITSGHYDFGIKNTDQDRPCRTKDSTPARNLLEDPENSLFWDHHGHLTALGNKILAEYIRMLIAAPYQVVPQMRACEKGASQAGRNVSSRLFHLRGGLDVHSPAASGLMASHFSFTKDQQIDVPLDGQATYVKAFTARKNYAVNSNIDPLEEQQLNALPALNMDRESCGKFGVFVSGDYYYGTRHDRDDVEGYRHTSKTVTVGGDYRFKPWLLGGIAMSYTKGKTKLNRGMGQIALDGYSVTLYDSMKWGGFYVDSALSYGWNQIDVKRNVPQFLTTAVANPIGTNWGASGLVGYDVNYCGWRFGPTANLNYGKTKVTSYREEGGLIFNMLVHEQNTKTMVGSLGGHISYDWDMCGGTLTPTFHGSYDHEFKNRDRLLVTELSSMRGIPQHLPVASNDNNYYRFGGGFNWRSSGNNALSFDYETIVARKHSRDHFFFVKYRHLF